MLTNLKDVGAHLLKEILREGVVLHGKLVVTPDHLAIKPYFIVSYDLHGTSSTTRQRVARRVYGYVPRKRVGERVREYRYPGLVDRRDCFVLGKGVVALPVETAKGFIGVLKSESREGDPVRSLYLTAVVASCGRKDPAGAPSIFYTGSELF